MMISQRTASIPASFRNGEWIAFCLVESALSLIATYTDTMNFPGKSLRRFSLEVVTNGKDSSDAMATIDAGVNAGGTTLYGVFRRTGISLTGYKFNVKQAVGFNFIEGTHVTNYSGDHVWGGSENILVDIERMTLVSPHPKGRGSHSRKTITDNFKRVTDIRAWQFDWGLDVVTRDASPRDKWIETSWYSRQHGHPGALLVTKRLLKPESAWWQIDYRAESFNDAGKFNYSGEVTIRRKENVKEDETSQKTDDAPRSAAG